MPSRLKVRVKLKGVAEAISRMRHLKATIRNKITRKALGEVAKKINKDARAGIPVESGLLKKSEGWVTRTYRNSSTVVIMVGPRHGFKQLVTMKRGWGAGRQMWRDPTKYAHLVT